MIWILLAVAVGALIWLGRKRVRQPNEWRTAAGVIGIVCILAGLVAGMRGAWLLGSILGSVGLSLLLTARRVILPGVGMSEARARQVLGVAADADEAAIQAAYRARMRTAHPDQGGKNEAAAQLNAARDVLLKRKA